MLRTLLVVISFSTLGVGSLIAQMSYGRMPRMQKTPDLPAGVKITQNLGAQVPLDMVFHDHHGKEVRLADCVNGKPTVLVMAYFSCPKLCTEVLTGLVGEMRPLTKLGLRVGKQFNVLTVSINPKDGPLMARPKRESYQNAYDRTRAEEEPGFAFVTASHGQGTNLVDADAKIRKLAEIVGFGYKADNHDAYDTAYAIDDETKRNAKLDAAIRKTKDYVHPSMVVVLTPEGKIAQYFHGLPRSSGGEDLDDGYTAEDLRKALSAASNGKTDGTMLQRMAISCYAYDDLSGTYKLNMTRLKWAAAPFPFLVIGLVYYARRQARREKQQPTAVEAETGWVPVAADSKSK